MVAMTEKILVGSLGMDLQTRCSTSTAFVDELGALISEGVELDPPVAFRLPDGAVLLVDGYHRVAALSQAGKREVLCEVRSGSRWEALQYGLAVNRRHRGQPLTRADRRHAVKMILEERPELSDSAVAKLAGVSATTAGKYRATFQIGKSDTRVGLDGRTISTANIGCRAAGEGDDHQAESAPTVADVDHCRCGGERLSDGEGGRSCEACHADHAGDADQGEAAAVPEADPPQPVEVAKSQDAQRAPPAKPAEDYYNGCVRALGDIKRGMDALASLWPGPGYTVAMAAANKLSDELRRWKEADQGGGDASDYPF